VREGYINIVCRKQIMKELTIFAKDRVGLLADIT
jgi:hypothetical protein